MKKQVLRLDTYGWGQLTDSRVGNALPIIAKIKYESLLYSEGNHGQIRLMAVENPNRNY